MEGDIAGSYAVSESVSIQVKAAGLQLASLAIAHIPGAIEKARRYSLQKALSVMRSRAVELTTEKYYAKASEIRRAMTLTRGRDAGRLIVRGQRRTLRHYKLTPTSPGKRKRRLKGAVEKEGGLKELSSRAFLFRSGGVWIPMKRTGRGRSPIRPIMSPAIPQIVNKPDTIDAVREAGYEALAKEFRRQSMRILGVMK